MNYGKGVGTLALLAFRDQRNQSIVDQLVDTKYFSPGREVSLKVHSENVITTLVGLLFVI